MTHRIVYKADMCAPAGFAAIDRLELSLSSLGSPQRPKVVIVIREAAEFLSQLARPYVTVIVDTAIVSPAVQGNGHAVDPEKFACWVR